jgi:hypothetical protein
VKHEYPKFIYHKSHEPKVVQSKEQHEKHGDEWKESPALVEVEEIEEPKKRGRKPKADGLRAE